MIPLREAFINKKNLYKVSAKSPNPFGLTKKDLNGDIEDFPMGVVVRMMEEQEKQGNKPDVKVFQESRNTGSIFGGFDWGQSEKKYPFWYSVIYVKKFDLFFEKYPEYKKYNI